MYTCYINNLTSKVDKMTTDQSINTRIAMLLNSGVDLVIAFDMVLGKGAYLKLAGAVYDTIKAKQTTTC